MGYFRETRNVELSTIYFLKNQIDANWSGVSTVKSFTQATRATLPVVCVRLIETNPKLREIGSTTLEKDHFIAIDIFATSDGQRLDLADFIRESLKDGWVHYDFSQTSGDTETLTRVENGRDFIIDFSEDRRLDFGENVDEYDKFRHFILIKVRKN